jgi:hypothetical protein
MNDHANHRGHSRSPAITYLLEAVKAALAGELKDSEGAALLALLLAASTMLELELLFERAFGWQ